MVVAIRHAIGSRPNESKSVAVSEIVPLEFLFCDLLMGGSSSPFSSMNINSTQLSAVIGFPSSGRSQPSSGIGVIADILYRDGVLSCFEISQSNSVGPSSGSRCERIKWPVKHHTIALATDAFPEPFAPSRRVTFLSISKTKSSGAALAEPNEWIPENLWAITLLRVSSFFSCCGLSWAVLRPSGISLSILATIASVSVALRLRSHFSGLA